MVAGGPRGTATGSPRGPPATAAFAAIAVRPTLRDAVAHRSQRVNSRQFIDVQSHTRSGHRCWPVQEQLASWPVLVGVKCHKIKWHNGLQPRTRYWRYWPDEEQLASWPVGRYLPV